jgi:DNA-binding MarR family transcriptional regulator
MMSSHQPEADVIDDLANRLHSLAIHLLRRVRSVDREAGLTAERLSLLSVLVYGGDHTIGELAEAEMVSLPAVTRSVTALESAGLLVRARDQGDRRRVRVSATGEGRRLMEEARGRRLRALRRDLGQISGADAATLATAIEILETMIGQGAPPSPHTVQH